MIKGKIEKLKIGVISISQSQIAQKILFGVLIVLFLGAVPLIALKYGASGDGLAGIVLLFSFWDQIIFYIEKIF